MGNRITTISGVPPHAAKKICKYAFGSHYHSLELNQKDACFDVLQPVLNEVDEAIQTILRREAYPEPYEALKALPRTHSKIDQKAIASFIEALNASEAVKEELLKITPEDFMGIYDS